MARVLDLPEGGWLALHERWLDEPEATRLYEELRDGIVWKQEKVRFYGKEHLQPRLTAWHGDPDARYTYSGLSLAPEPWTATLRALGDAVSVVAASPMNSVLLNYYRDGRDSIGMHADAERELGQNPVIASLSLGATRRFVLRPKKGSARGGLDLDLESGSLLVLGGAVQHLYRHGVPRQPSVALGRINLTFRRISPPGGARPER